MKMKQSPWCGLLPLPIIGQPGIFWLIPSLARKTHNSTVSWRLIGWHHAMNTRACFCSNIKNKTHFRLDSNQHLRIISSAFCHWTTCPRRTQSRLLLVSFYGAGWGSRTLISTSAKSHINRYVKPAISSIACWLLRTYLLLQQGILNHCCWSTERISKPYLQLWSQNQDLNLNLQNSVLR